MQNPTFKNNTRLSFILETGECIQTTFGKFTYKKNLSEGSIIFFERELSINTTHPSISRAWFTFHKTKFPHTITSIKSEGENSYSIFLQPAPLNIHFFS